MNKANPEFFHKIYGKKRARTVFRDKDFIDYVLMILICAAIVYFSYRNIAAITILGIVICILMIGLFIIRHGFKLSMPLILRQPQDVVFMLVYKIQNMKPAYFLAAAVLLLENVFVYLTPQLPHHTEEFRTVALYLFFIHLIVITIYRTVSFVDHLRKKELVRTVLLETVWKRHLSKQSNITIEIIHAYLTGLLTHIVLLAPWFIVINWVNYSVIFLPLALVANMFIRFNFIKTLNAWFYRDHWLGHNSEFEFIYLHGTHHDVIPSGLIAVAGNGYLEGFMRQTMGFPNIYYNPLLVFYLYTTGVKTDIDSHQYIPGIYPHATRRYHEIAQHSLHHFGKLEPYSFGMKMNQPHIPEKDKKGTRSFPDELRNSIDLDEQLTGYEWDNESNRKYLALFDKYKKQKS